MTSIANVDLEFLANTASLKRIATTTSNSGIDVIRVDSRFHDSDTSKFTFAKTTKFFES